MPEYHVLIVDDQPDIRRLLRASLEMQNRGFKVVDVPSGEEAMLVISKQPIDLLVADVRLPGISGLELKEKALVRNPHLKLILVTGLTDPEIRRQVAEGKADAYFIKPIEIMDFINAVERCLGLSPTILGAPPPPVVEEKPQLLNLTDCVRTIHRQVNALAVQLIDHQGKIVALSGEIPNPAEINSVLRSIIQTAQAGFYLAQVIGNKEDDFWMVFPGKDYFLFIYQIGLWGILSVYNQLALVENYPVNILHSVGALRPKLLSLLTTTDLPSPIQIEQLPVQGPDVTIEETNTLAGENEVTTSQPDALLAELLKLTPGQFPGEKELDSFWDTVIQKGSFTGKTDPRSLSFEQARKLGLVSEEDE